MNYNQLTQFTNITSRCLFIYLLNWLPQYTLYWLNYRKVEYTICCRRSWTDIWRPGNMATKLAYDQILLEKASVDTMIDRYDFEGHNDLSLH